MVAKVWEVFWVALRLGLTSFGGPIAHIGYFHKEYVHKRRWLDEARFAELVSLGQFLPGPASSQTGMAIGLTRAGTWGAVAAWVGFTLPSAVLMVAFAVLMRFGNLDLKVGIHAMEIVALAVVGQALLGMGKRLLGGPKQITVALATVLLLALFPSNFAQIAVLAGAGLLGLVLFRAQDQPPPTTPGASSGIVLAVGCLALFAGLLIVGPFLAAGRPGADLAALGESFYRVGALVFGGGHVVLPLLKEAVVTPGWVLPGVFMAGYGFAQAVPGPLFSLSAFLGFQVAGWWGAVVALTAIFLPSFLLVAGVLPFWSQVRSNRTIAAALTGVNAAVVGLLAAAFYDPIGTLAIKTPTDFSLALVLFALLEVWKVPTWTVVLIGLAGAGVLSLFGL